MRRLFLLFLILSSCNSINNRKNINCKGFINKNIRVNFYKDCIVKSIETIDEKGNLNGESFYFYENGNLRRRASYFKGKLTGRETEYSINGNIKLISDYFLQNSQSVLNSRKAFDSLGIIIPSQSKFVEIIALTDTLNLGDESYIKIKYIGSEFSEKEKGVNKVIILGDIDNDYNILMSNKLKVLPLNNNIGVIKLNTTNLGSNKIKGLVLEKLQEGDNTSAAFSFFEYAYYIRGKEKFSYTDNSLWSFLRVVDSVINTTVK